MALEPGEPAFDQLAEAAHHGERVAARRMARRDGVTEAQALRLTLERAAAPDGLATLLQQRRQLRHDALERQAGKAAQKAAALARKQAARQAPAGAWMGWFDGSAQPNPGRIGIGARLTGPDGTEIDISRRAGYGNSGEAEYAALLALLEVAVARAPAVLVIHGDSRVVIDDVQQGDGPGAVGLGRQRTKARTLLAQLPAVTLRWVPRHRNGVADQLSQRAGRLPADDDQEDDEADDGDAGAVVN